MSQSIKRSSLFEHIIFNLENHSARKVYIICESYCEKGFGVFLESLERPCTDMGEIRGTLHGYERVSRGPCTVMGEFRGTLHGSWTSLEESCTPIGGTLHGCGRV